MLFSRLAFLSATVCLAGSADAQTFTERSDLLPSDGSNISSAVLGASSADINGDGRIDIYQSDRLYVNMGESGFVDAYEQSGLDQGEAAFGAIFGDYDNDGLLDVFFEDLIAPSNLFRQLAPGSFLLADSRTGVDTEDVPIQGSIWLDYNNDGRLDLFVGGDGATDVLFRNVTGSTFENANQFLGLEIERGVYGAAAADFDRDGDLDIYVAACRPSNPEVSRNMLWRNDNGTFVEANLGVDDTGDSWGTVWLDFDNDGWMDLFVVNSASGQSQSGYNSLFWNDRQGGFADVGGSAGVAGGEADYGYNVAAADFDNDGWTDLYVVNSNNQPDLLYRNLGGTRFDDVFEASGVGDGTYGFTVGDYDDDGYVDIFHGTAEGGRLFINDGGSNNWLKVLLRGVQANRFGIGARVELFEGGQIAQVREITAGEGMTSQHHGLLAHFGLGQDTIVDSVVVRWPGGNVDVVHDVTANQHLVVTEGNPPTSTENPLSVLEETVQPFPNPFRDQVTISFTLREPAHVNLFVTDLLGRRVVTLLNESEGMGEHRVQWNGRASTDVPVAPGVYLVRLVTRHADVAAAAVRVQ